MITVSNVHQKANLGLEKFMAIYTYTSATNTTLPQSAITFPLSILTLDSTNSLLNGVSSGSLYDSTSKGFVVPFNGIYHFGFSCVLASGSSLNNLLCGLVGYNCLGNGTTINMQTAITHNSTTGEIAHVSGCYVLNAGNTIVPIIYNGGTTIVRGSGGNAKFVVTMLSRLP